jgi:hypothetical protein
MFFVFAIMFLAYVLPLPSLLIGWTLFFREKKRFEAPKWRAVSGFSGLVLASAVAVLFFFANYLISGRNDIVQLIGVCLSLACLLMGLAGTRPLRLPVSLAAVGLMCLWAAARIDI